MEEASPKPRQDGEASGNGVIGLLAAEQDDCAVEIPIKEELVEEVMQELYRELHSKAPSNRSDTAPLHNAESCGASVSDSASTVMAGIELVGSTARVSAAGKGYYWWGQVGNGCCRIDWPVGVGDHRDDDHDKKRKIGLGKGIDGCDGVAEEEVDDEWLARVLSWGPVAPDPGL